LVPHYVVTYPGVVAKLMPTFVATVAEDHLVSGRAVHATAFLAQGLLGGALAVVVGRGAGPLAGGVHGGRVIGGWLENLSA